MPITREQIRDGLSHTMIDVRTHALAHFAQSFDAGDDLWPAAVSAIEQFGFDAAFRRRDMLATLTPTPETISWWLRRIETKRVTDADGEEVNYLRMFLQVAPLESLAAHREAAMAALDERGQAVLRERFELAELDAETLWAKLVAFSEENRAVFYTDEVDYPHASRIVRELAAKAEPLRDRVLEIIAREPPEADDDPLGWLQPLAVRLAGEMRLTDAVETLIAKIQEDADLVCEEADEALAKIGSLKAIELAAEAWDPSRGNVMLAVLFGRIPCDAAVERGLQLVEATEDVEMKLMLATELTFLCDERVVEPLRSLTGLVHRETIHLKRGLRDVCILGGIDLPERATWDEEIAENERQVEQSRESFARASEFENVFYEGFDWEKLSTPGAASVDTAKPVGKSPPPAPVAKPAPPRTEVEDILARTQAGAARRSSGSIVRTKQKVRRNDPCPCGSGKKYKKCCM